MRATGDQGQAATTSVWHCQVGCAATVGQVAFPWQGMAVKHGRFLQDHALDPKIASVAGAEFVGRDERMGIDAAALIGEHLAANPGYYTRRLLSDAAMRGETRTFEASLRDVMGRAQLGDGLDWTRMRIDETTVFVPAMDQRVAVDRLGDVADAVRDRITTSTTGGSRGAGEGLAHADGSDPTLVSETWLFAGTHIEAVPGTCVLPGLAAAAEAPGEGTAAPEEAAPGPEPPGAGGSEPEPTPGGGGDESPCPDAGP